MTAQAPFVLPDRTSPVYYRYLAVAGEGIAVEGDALLAGDLHSNGDAYLQRDSSLLGGVSAVGRVHEARGVRGRVEEGAEELALPAPITEAEAEFLAGSVFEGNTLFEGDLILDEVVFVAGNATVLGRLGGEGTIIATGDIRLTPVDPADAAPVDTRSRVSLIAFRDIRVGRGRALRGALYAGGDIHLGKDVEHQGVLIAGGRLHVRKRPGLVFEDFDAEPPTIAFLAPPVDTIIALAAPRISASFADDLSGVDPETFTFTLDGVDRSTEAAADTNEFSYTPSFHLAQGPHIAEVAVADTSGKWAKAIWTFVVDTEPPVVAVTAPTDPLFEDEAGRVEVAYRDTASGVHLPTVSVTVDGVDITSNCKVGPGSATCVAEAGKEGLLAIRARVSDRAGNSATNSVQLGAGCDPGAGDDECLDPPLAIALPPAFVPPPRPGDEPEAGDTDPGPIEEQGPHRLAITAPEDGSLVAQRTVTVTGSAPVEAGAARLLVEGRPPTAVSGQFSVDVELSEGVNLLRLEALDRSGKRSVARVRVTRDTVPPVVTLDSPAAARTTNRPTVLVSGSAEDLNGVATVEIGGAPVALHDGRFEETVPLAEGLNVLSVRAVDAAGNAGEARAEVRRFAVPTVAIDHPRDFSVADARRIDVSGTVSDATAAVTVNGVRAAVTGGAFFAAGVPLEVGRTLINAVATLPNGHAASDSIAAFRDARPPRVRIDHPADGATLFDDTTTVTGLVNDLVLGTVNAAQATVTVNGVEAEVENRTFRALGVPLGFGGNEIVAEAVDASGNVARARVAVRREVATGPRVRIVAGNDQTGTVAAELPRPLEVVLLDAVGNPVPGRDVVFAVRGNDGLLGDAARRVAVTTGGDGRAAAALRLGTRAGVQLVEASAIGFAGPAVFTQAARPGVASVLLADSGDRQTGVAGGPLPRPLVAVATDAGLNRVEGAPVTFRVVRGDGRFENGLTETTVRSDGDGRAAAALSLGPEEGSSNNTVEARLGGDPPVVFTASGLVAGDPAHTSVGGVVVDSVRRPVPGVTVGVAGTELRARTDAAGAFTIHGAPLGSVVLEVDPARAARRGVWPRRELTHFNVPGRDNRLDGPIHLAPTAAAGGVSGAGGGRLELAELPGFRLEIAPGSVRFPDGTAAPVVRAAAVPNDQARLVPGFARPPRSIVTIQPAAARFDPPAPVVFPNLEGLPPGRTTNLYSLDAELGRFVSIGPGTVTADGLLIVSDPGVGVVTGGWLTAGDPGEEHGRRRRAAVAREARPPVAKLELTARTTHLRAAGETLRLEATGTLADGSRVDLTDAASGTDYRSSNPAIASVGRNGLVTAESSGTVLVSALNGGVLQVLPILVVLSGDTDGDGLPDDFEVARGLDPNDPVDALLDPDGDGLSTFDEYLAGLDPFDARSRR